MTDFVSNPFPSRMFVRFIAQKQLIADATGHTTILKAQRRGKDFFYHRFLPHQSWTVETSADNDNIVRDPLSTATDHRVEGALSSEAAPQSPVSEAGTRPHLSAQVDADLFEDIIKTSLTPQRWPALYQACKTPQAATELELKAAAAIVSTYRRIKLNQTHPIVQQLNQLL